MAPLKPVKKDGNDERIQPILDVAKAALERANAHLGPSISIAADLAAHIKRSLPLTVSTSLAGKGAELDSLGTRLWNESTDLLRQLESDLQGQEGAVETEKQKRTMNFVALLRVFAVFLIDAAHHTSSHRSKGSDHHVRIFKIALKATRFCLEKSELELSTKLLERLAEYASTVEDRQSATQQPQADDDDVEKLKHRLVHEYYLLRITHAWKSRRLDLAEHFSSKISQRGLTRWPEVAEKAADLYYEIGKSVVKKNKSGDAIRWLDRALQALSACEVFYLDQDAGELRLSIVSVSVKALLAANNTLASQRAWDLTEQLETTHGFGQRVVVSIMKLNILFSATPVRAEDAQVVISRMVRSALITEVNFQTIMHSIHRLKAVDVPLACRTLDELITSRILPNAEASPASEASMQDFLEKSTVTRTFFTTSTPPPATGARTVVVQELHALFDEISEHITHGFSAKATHAAQTLIWKASSSQDAEMLEAWVVLLQHPLFDGAGQINKAKIARKGMSAAIEKADYGAAREAFHQMPAASQNESLSRYLYYKVAVRSADYDLAVQCLDIVIHNSSKDATFLYACVLEAQHSDNRAMAVTALQALLENGPPGVHIPAVLRCTARLLISELGTNKCSLNDTMLELIRVFESAAANVNKLRQGTDEQWRAEIQWWSKNAYNLSLQYCVEMGPECLVRLLQACLKFLEQYPKDSGLMHHDDVLRRKLLCHFLTASALVTLGRAHEEDRESSLQYYMEARKHVQEHGTMLEGLQRSISSSADEKFSKELRTRQLEMLKLDLEAALKLQAWQDLDGMLDTCLKQTDLNRWDILADLVIVIHEEASRLDVESRTLAKLPELLAKVIKETWKNDKDVVQLARWLRMLLVMNLDIDDAASLGALAQALGLARKCQNSSSLQRYPEEELKWLATTAFNKGVDQLLADNSEACENWVNAAVDLANVANDQGVLWRVLDDKRQQLLAAGRGG